MRVFVVAILPLFAGAASALGAISAEATVESAVMALGQTNTYTITLKNSSETPHWAPPEVSGLVFSRTPSTQSTMQFINGVSSRETRLSWRFQAERTGEFVIPGGFYQVAGESVEVADVKVEVRETPPELRYRFFLRWKTPEGPFYVGQAIPVSLQLYVRSGMKATLSSVPEGESEQFMLSGFSGNPRQTQRSVDGETYVVVEWDTVVTPIRAGKGSLPVRLGLRYETGQTERTFFGMQPIQEQMILTTENHEWTILDLPASGRPASFTGGVGDFTVQRSLARNELKAGEPVTLSIEISGKGNFPRIEAPRLESADGWRIHPPRLEMEENGSAFEGVKKFEYILIPTTEAVREAPAAAFGWFDPDEREWKQIDLPGEPVVVDGSGTVSQVARFERDADSEESDFRRLEIATSMGEKRSLRSPFEQPVFWVVNGGLTCLFAIVAVGVVRKKRIEADPAAWARAEALRKAGEFKEQALRAAREKNAENFYVFARSALRACFGFPEGQTKEELEAKLADIPEEVAEGIRILITHNDAVAFAGWQPTDEDLQADKERFEKVLTELEQFDESFSTFDGRK
ncbi:MAG TPA: BatD family protein [Opitutales bacterium]|nr:BatD family protein [Opitutales bacterium]